MDGGRSSDAINHQEEKKPSENIEKNFFHYLNINSA